MKDFLMIGYVVLCYMSPLFFGIWTDEYFGGATTSLMSSLPSLGLSTAMGMCLIISTGFPVCFIIREAESFKFVGKLVLGYVIVWPWIGEGIAFQFLLDNDYSAIKMQGLVVLRGLFYSSVPVS